MKGNLRPAVMAVFVNNQNKVLIGSSPRDGGYKFPQGGLDPGERSLDGIKREVAEELGVLLKDDDILEECSEKVIYYYPQKKDLKNFDPNKIYPGKNYIGQEQIVFKIQYQKDMKLIPQDEEFEEMVWISPSELDQYDTQHRSDAYIKALKMCSLLSKGD